jgi:hypothetical protein
MIRIDRGFDVKGIPRLKSRMTGIKDRVIFILGL